MWSNRIQAFSFLCTFVPGSEKSTKRTFTPVELSFCGTFTPWNFRSSGVNVPRTFVPWNICSHRTFVPRERTFQELSFRGTFVPVDLSFLASKHSKNFHPMKLLFHENEYSQTCRSKCPKTRPETGYTGNKPYNSLCALITTHQP